MTRIYQDNNPTPVTLDYMCSIFPMKSVVVCASKRYAEEVKQFCEELISHGIVVFEPNIYAATDEAETFGNERITKAVFKGFTLEHFDWIRKADICFVYNKDGYTGPSVTLEIGYATALGKPIYALSTKTGGPCRDCLIDKTVASVDELVALVT